MRLALALLVILSLSFVGAAAARVPADPADPAAVVSLIPVPMGVDQVAAPALRGPNICHRTSHGNPPPRPGCFRG